MKLVTDTKSTKALASSSNLSPTEMTNNKRPSCGVAGSSLLVNLAELPNGNGHRRSDSQVWRPRNASSIHRPSWASIGHHAMMPWRSSSKFDSEHTIRLVESSEGSEYDAETDSIWGPLEDDTDSLLRRNECEEDDVSVDAGYPKDWLQTPRARASQPAMPTRCPPPPPPPDPRILDTEAQISKFTKKSRFIEHVDENAEMLRRLGIPYDEGRRRGIGIWFNSLTRR